MTAKELLKKIVAKRNWYAGLPLSRQEAAAYKQLILKEKMSVEKCSDFLLKLGYKKIQEERWEINIRLSPIPGTM